MPFGTEVGLGPGHILLDGDPAPPPRKGHSSALQFSAMSIVAKRSPISVTAELFMVALCNRADHYVFAL